MVEKDFGSTVNYMLINQTLYIYVYIDLSTQIERSFPIMLSESNASTVFSCRNTIAEFGNIRIESLLFNHIEYSKTFTKIASDKQCVIH
jgi:hypothetical protein